jgi:hypothetical protein
VGPTEIGSMTCTVRTSLPSARVTAGPRTGTRWSSSVHPPIRFLSPGATVRRVDRWCGLTGSTTKERVVAMVIVKKSIGIVRQCIDRVRTNLEVLAGPDELTY